MKTITIRQPYASLIIEDIKDIENRAWKCPEKYIGQRVLIHSSASKYIDNLHLLLDYSQIVDIKEQNKEAELFGSDLTRGAIIGSVEIVDCVINHPSIWAEETSPMADNTVYNWVLTNPIKFKTPIPAKGRLSFWDYNGIIEEL